MTEEHGGSPRFYLCSCFTTDNIFLEDYKLHVRFVSEQQFRLDYEQVSVSPIPSVTGLKHTAGGRFGNKRCVLLQLLRGLGCVTQQQFDHVLKQAG